jgi:hypothetical protein
MLLPKYIDGDLYSRRSKTMSSLKTQDEEFKSEEVSEGSSVEVHDEEFSSEELERMEAEVYGLTEQDSQRDVEFGHLENLREEHFTRMEMLEEDRDKNRIKYPIHEYMVDGLMPLNELHIVAGESGAGKSTWLLQMIDDWQNERPVLGRRSTWYPYVIFVQDRTKAGVFRTLERMRLNPKAFPVQSALEGGDLSLAAKIKDFKRKNPDVRIIFVEGLHVGLEDSNDYGKTSTAIRELIALCQTEKLTIVATTHMSKDNARKRNSGRGAVLGSSAAPAMSEANILLNKQKNGTIKLTAHGRNEVEIVRFYRWGTEEMSGRLIECEGDKEQSPMVEFLQNSKARFRREDVVEFFTKKELSPSSADRAIKKAKEKGWIVNCVDEKTGKEQLGHYRKAEEKE